MQTEEEEQQHQEEEGGMAAAELLDDSEALNAKCHESAMTCGYELVLDYEMASSPRERGDNIMTGL